MDGPADRPGDPPDRDGPLRELVHIDVKKLARIPDGGGHRMHGRAGTRNGSMSKRGNGYTHVHTAIDAYSRLAYSEFGHQREPAHR